MSDSINSLGSQPTQSATRSKDADQRSAHRHKPADLRQQAQVFRELVAKPLTAQQLVALTARGSVVPARTADDLSTPLHTVSDDFRRRDVDISATLTMQRTLDQVPSAQGVPPAATPDLSVAELIEKHVRRVLASQEVGRTSAGGEVRLELSDAVLPGMALSLRRTADGWRLSASADNKQSLDRLNQFAPALVERFAAASLGRLEISVDGDA